MSTIKPADNTGWRAKILDIFNYIVKLTNKYVLNIWMEVTGMKVVNKIMHRVLRKNFTALTLDGFL